MEDGYDISGLGEILNSQGEVCTGFHEVHTMAHENYRYALSRPVNVRCPTTHEQYSYTFLERLAAACKLRGIYRNSEENIVKEQALQELKKSRLGRVFSYI